MNLLAFAQNELDLAGLTEDADPYDGLLRTSILDMVKVFSEQGHSGLSASMVTSALSKLLAYEPLTSITGADDEWVEVGEQSGYPLFQNKRCSHVFKEGEKAYDTQGIVFEEPNGSRYIGKGSRVDVHFPYTPTQVVIQREEEA